MGEFEKFADSGSSRFRPFPQDMEPDSISPDYMNESDRAIYRRVQREATSDATQQVSPVTGQPVESAPCPTSADYDSLLVRAYENMYEPEKLNFSEIRTKFNCQIKNTEDAVRFAGDALRTTKDPYNTVFNKRQADEMSRDSQGKFHGFGFNFAPKADVDGKPGLPSPLRVTGLMKGSPVEAAGIKDGDYIVAVDGVSLQGKTFDEAFKLVQAEKAKQFTISRDSGVFPVNLTPADIDVPAVTEKRLDGNVAYIKMSTFGQSDTAQELKAALEKHADADGYVIDLRHNPGGFFEEAIKSASLFVKEGTVVSVRQRLAPTPPASTASDGSTGAVRGIATKGIQFGPGSMPPRPNYERVTYVLTPNGLDRKYVNEANPVERVTTGTRLPDLVDKPTVILVDGESASSSEVFAGALKDHGDATVIGTKTYGKGIGQMNYYNMAGGSTLRVTNFRYFTPNGTWPGDASANRPGIQPDQVVMNPPGVERGSSSDQQLKAAVAEINKKLGR